MSDTTPTTDQKAPEYKDVESDHQAAIAMSTGARLEMRRTVKQMFTHHPVQAGSNQERRYRLIREGAMDLAETIYLNTPRCADQSAAIRHLREAVFTANAAIALDGAV